MLTSSHTPTECVVTQSYYLDKKTFQVHKIKTHGVSRRLEDVKLLVLTLLKSVCFSSIRLYVYLPSGANL